MDFDSDSESSQVAAATQAVTRAQSLGSCAGPAGRAVFGPLQKPYNLYTPNHSFISQFHAVTGRPLAVLQAPGLTVTVTRDQVGSSVLRHWHCGNWLVYRDWHPEKSGRADPDSVWRRCVGTRKCKGKCMGLYTGRGAPIQVLTAKLPVAKGMSGVQSTPPPPKNSRTTAKDKETGRFVTDNELSSKFIIEYFLFRTTYHENRTAKNKGKSTNDYGWYTRMEKDWSLWLECKRSESPVFLRKIS